MKPNPTSVQSFFSRWSKQPSRTLLLSLLISLLTVISSGCTLPISGIINAQEGLNPNRPTTPIIAIAPDFGVPGTAIAIAGAGWQPTDLITLKLASATEPGALEESITVVTVAEDGTFTSSITFPEAERWRIFPNVLVIAESAQTGVRANASFELLPVGLTVTATVSMTVTAEPSATPTAATSATTSGATATPTPATSATTSGATATWTALPGTTSTPAPTATATPVRPTSNPTATSTPIVLGANQVYVTSNGLNVRSGPGVAYAIVRAVRYGTILDVLGQSSGSGWLQVRLSDGATGWVSRYYTSGSVNPPVVQPTNTPLPTATGQATAVITNWRGEYYTNRDLSGSPYLVRNDDTVDFNYGTGSPASGIPSDGFSVRWTRSPYFDSGRYRFHVRVDDGARLYVDDSLIIDQWNDGSEREFTADRDLGSGNHSLRVEYYENTGGARITLWWERIGNTGGTDNDDDDFDDWKGEYYTNRDLDDDPRFRRNDEDIDFNWGDDSPDSRIPDDNFSVRWSQRVRFDRGHYRFEFRADDGIRFYIDGNRVLNEWHENDYDNDYQLEFDLDGRHDLTVEYYERRGGARVYVDWDRIGDIVTPTQTPVPATATPMPTNTPITPPATATAVAPTNTPGATDTPTLTPTVVQPSANVQPNAGGPGTTITVNGGGFPANTTVNVHLGAFVGVRSSAIDPESYATTTTDRTGSYSVAFDLPATWPDGNTIGNGQLMVMVATENFGQQATAILNFTAVAPTPTATETATPPALPTATGTQPATSTPTNTPLATPTPAETATPVPQPFVNLDPTAATPGTLIQVTGGGFPANTQLGLYLGIFDGEISPNDSAVTFASTISDGEGNYTMSFVMPEDTPTGVLIQSGKIAVIVATNGFELQASATLDFTGNEPTPEPTATVVAAAGQSSDDANGTIPPVEGESTE